MGQMKEQVKTPVKELSDEEIANLSDAEFKTLVIRMLTEMVEYGRKIEEKVKAMKNEVKESVQGINREGKETRAQINDLEQNKKINIQPEQNEEIRIQKHEESLSKLWDFNRSNIQIIGVAEGEEEEQEIENSFENIMKENFPNLAKKIDFHTVQEAQRVPKNLDTRKHSPKANHNYIIQD